jgi:NAD(P)-dependent dehydrogenase (short-subunit alcohol dehydrogenase family)
MTGSLAGRCAVITGAGGGLGRAFALGFARAGARVVAADLDGEAAAKTCTAMRGTVDGSEAVAVTVDVADEASTAALAAAALVLSGSPLWAHYVASKSALIGLSRVLARELGADGVRVNALAPGFTLTEASRELIDDAETHGVARVAIKRGLQPQDIVGTAVFLASEASAMMTGQTIVVDGGRQFL